jgi:hypothetical protein
MFVGDIKLYLTNNFGNVNITLTFVSLNSCKENISFYLEIRCLVIFMLHLWIHYKVTCNIYFIKP